MKGLLRALAVWRGRALPPQSATTLRRAARDSAFSLLELELRADSGFALAKRAEDWPAAARQKTPARITER
jgi:hypothetical protein